MLNRLFTRGVRTIVRAASVERYSFKLEKFKEDPNAFYKMIRGRLEFLNLKDSLPKEKDWLLARVYDSLDVAEHNSSKRVSAVSSLSSIYANLRDLEGATQDVAELRCMVENLRADALAKPVLISVELSHPKKRNYSSLAQQKSSEVAKDSEGKDLYVTTSMINSFGGLGFLKRLTDMAKANGMSAKSITCLRVLRKETEDYSVLINAKTSIKVNDFISIINEILERQKSNEANAYLAAEIHSDFTNKVIDLKANLDESIIR